MANLDQFYMKYHWGGGKAALGFVADWIKTLVSTATKISHRLKIGGIVVDTIAPLFLIGPSSNLQATRTGIKSRMNSISGQIGLFAL